MARRSNIRLGDDGTTYEELTSRERKELTGGEYGTAFDVTQRLFPHYRGGAVFDYGFAEVADIHAMLKRDGKARGLEQVLTLPLRGAKHEITGPRADWVRERIPDLDLVIDQMTSAVIYRKAFFEKVWRLDGGEVSYEKVAFRPAVGCSAAYSPTSGELIGFKQRTYDIGLNLSQNRQLIQRSRETPGNIFIPHSRSFVYIHGLHREPILGLSDMEVAHWAYETRQKVLFLWFQFLENQSIPSRVFYGEDQTQADMYADEGSKLKASGVMGMKHPPEGQRAFEVMDSAGAGAGQFQEVINYLESMMTQSVLASFMDLPQAASQGRGSYALSSDQSEFFLTSRQGVADEMAQALNRRLIKPLVAYNFGEDEPAPEVSIGPLGKAESERALTLLSSIIVAPELNVPIDFVGTLVQHTASYLGLNESEVAQQIEGYAERRSQQQAREDELEVQEREASIEAQRRSVQASEQAERDQRAGGRPDTGSTPNGPQNRRQGAGNTSRDMTTAVDAAYELIHRAQRGEDPQDIVRGWKRPGVLDLAREGWRGQPRWPRGGEKGGQWRPTRLSPQEFEDMVPIERRLYRGGEQSRGGQGHQGGATR